jgi:hypothetical protein
LGGLSPAGPAGVTRRSLGVRVYHLGAALGVGSRLRHRWRLPPTTGPAGLGFGVVGVIRERKHAQTLRTAKGVSHTLPNWGPARLYAIGLLTSGMGRSAPGVPGPGTPPIPGLGSTPPCVIGESVGLAPHRATTSRPAEWSRGRWPTGELAHRRPSRPYLNRNVNDVGSPMNRDHVGSLESNRG